MKFSCLTVLFAGVFVVFAAIEETFLLLLALEVLLTSLSFRSDTAGAGDATADASTADLSVTASADGLFSSFSSAVVVGETGEVTVSFC